MGRYKHKTNNTNNTNKKLKTIAETSKTVPIAETSKTIPIAETSEPTFEETCIIIDWDDTLLCTSWLASKGLGLDSDISEENKLALDEYATSVCNILEKALSCSTVTIITNAEIGWVEMSCKKFIPSVSYILSRIKIISARSTFEKISPGNPTVWKELAFKQEISIKYSDNKLHSLKNLISFGDSIHERIAIHKCGETFKSNFIKSIKFVERPTIEQLKRQIDLVTPCIVEIFKRKEHLDLMLTIQLIYE